MAGRPNESRKGLDQESRREREQAQAFVQARHIAEHNAVARFLEAIKESTDITKMPQCAALESLKHHHNQVSDTFPRLGSGGDRIVKIGGPHSPQIQTGAPR